ncbi:amino acid/amide ABC transporter ATP-binding protein 2 (HAAT family) [Microbacterium telephonicum]|uniref:Amino acid/amide ABC transporter ATP-binding protein 2 (HAAT family) n=1 Tax=Microbacterium telephonicum TaxID=1714841 RepID=A0A498C0A6_9MICO|nr:ABC transporter ATP-binding protein [Microbacterium telephonicum]RLK47906.1 amino acid/amide ABC transporter ATP-binding protein 2 (HAAT family) [Microbacterium telephonicum]
MSEPLLEFRGVSVDYGPSRALSDVSLTLDAGHVVCLLGGNASGKSTTMKTILGLVRPAAGSVHLDGADITKWSTPRRVQAGLASVPEARRVFPEMTVEDNLLTGAYTRRDRAVRATLDEVYTFFPRLRERRRQLAGTMSGGEQQMLAFGRALMSRPRLICMDEPTMGLAPIVVERVLEHISRISQELGVSVFLVEQNAELALQVADRGYVLRTGEIAVAGTARELLANPGVREAYLGGGGAAGAGDAALDPIALADGIRPGDEPTTRPDPRRAHD